MLFCSDPEGRFFEQLMMTVPQHISNERGLSNCGFSDKVLWEDERIKNGEAGYQEILLEATKMIRCPPFEKRLRQYLKESEESPMIYKNEKHRSLFKDVVRKKDKKNYAFLAAVYLLTADVHLWNVAKHHVKKMAIDFGSMKLKGIHESGYVLFCGAKDLYVGTKHLCIADLADTQLISPKIFVLLCNAMAIRRFGSAALKDRERTVKDDPDNRKTE